MECGVASGSGPVKELATDEVVLGSELPSPEEHSLEDSIWGESSTSTTDDTVSKGYLGSFLRKIRRVPPYIWVVNQRNEDITVVVSKYRPNRLLTGLDVSITTTGGGIGLSQTTYTGPATKKTLAPESKDPASSKATFPLWTTKDAYAVVSIFTGPEQIIHIENDQIPAGATAYVVRGPDMRIEPWKPV